MVTRPLRDHMTRPITSKYQRLSEKRMEKKKENKLPPVFSRMSEDITNWTNKTAIQRVTGAGFYKERILSEKVNSELQKSLSTSHSNLGKAILYGNKSYQRHLDIKMADIEKQRIRRLRNMEWNQLNSFRQLVKEGIARHKKGENSSKKEKKYKLQLPDVSHYSSNSDMGDMSNSKKSSKGALKLKLPEIKEKENKK